MKTKKLIPFLALFLCLPYFSGCKKDQTVSFGNYWEKVSLAPEGIDETLVYNVRLEKTGNTLWGYSLDYTNGVYNTHLASITDETNSLPGYSYTTELTIDATYTCNGVASEPLKDTVFTEVKFLSAEHGFRPISSKKTVKSHSPTTNESTTVSDCYQFYHYEVNTAYDWNGNKGVSTLTYFNEEGEQITTETKEFDVPKEDFRFLDNEQLPFALRGISNTTSSATFWVYSPFLGLSQQVALTFSEEESAEFSFYRATSEEKQKATITYRPVKMVLNEKNPGATQTIWVAKMTATQENTFRNVILKMECPVSYNLGSLIYELRSTSW